MVESLSIREVRALVGVDEAVNQRWLGVLAEAEDPALARVARRCLARTEHATALATGALEGLPEDARLPIRDPSYWAHAVEAVVAGGHAFANVYEALADAAGDDLGTALLALAEAERTQSAVLHLYLPGSQGLPLGAMVGGKGEDAD